MANSCFRIHTRRRRWWLNPFVTWLPPRIANRLLGVQFRIGDNGPWLNPFDMPAGQRQWNDHGRAMV